MIAALLVSMVPACAGDPAPLVIPAWSAFARPDARALRRDERERVRGFAGELAFYAHLAATGALTVEVELGLAPGDDGAALRELAAGLSGTLIQQNGDVAVPLVFTAVPPATLRAAPVTVAEPGYHRVALTRAGGATGALAAPIVGLHLAGAAAAGARASTVERRNAASVHLGYPRPPAADGRERDDVAYFHCRVTPRSEPLWTYYMATGWHRGYFGLQVNSETERRVIFSVWDSGDEAVDRAKVAADDLVQLVAKGRDVHASGFGNEGTGGHSHLVFPWRLGDSFDFLVEAVPEGARTTYTGWFRVAPAGAAPAGEAPWRLVASFRAPKDGRHLRGLYSFNENFAGSNGDVRRVCEFDAQWVRTADGAWHELCEAHFTHDGHGAPDEHGHSGRLDRSGGVRGARFYLAHGGFVEDTTPGAATAYGARLARAAVGGAPPLTDAELAALPRE